MPKFAIESDLDLKEIFVKFGSGRVFSAAMDDYSPLTDESVFLSMAKHKAKKMSFFEKEIERLEQLKIEEEDIQYEIQDKEDEIRCIEENIQEYKESIQGEKEHMRELRVRFDEDMKEANEQIGTFDLG
ncbi:Oidioi.mRNA.OKI2018_I69.chr2.g8033.t1.cds [Oikopleura dioica]|uniref:Oidioi.mRNA.OKI2018_I69.chr2.g8033.t1.cds n=1 Tax=Oikopleura dioica TaxID=34765 RepID=A0ABN7TDR9_OIKDI|nr:Oidioi.mRNA.OKI2018_I69.chr2.g8033.t1.cds [Oikopleura dioica]